MKLLNAKIIAKKVVDELHDLCDAIIVAGSIRRQCPDVNDIDIVLIPKPDKIEVIKLRCLEHHPLMDNTLEKPKWGPNMGRFSYEGQIYVDIYPSTFKEWPIKLLIRTGSANFNKGLMIHAKTMGRALAADGSGMWYDRDRTREAPCKNEADIFAFFQIPFMEPKDRDGGLMEEEENE